MDVDPMEAAKSATEDPQSGAHHLGAMVAVTVALLATFMGICKVKDDNIVQAMQQAQADKLDSWSFYQWRKFRQKIPQAPLVEPPLRRDAAPPNQRAPLDSAVARYQAL